MVRLLPIKLIMIIINEHATNKVKHTKVMLFLRTLDSPHHLCRIIHASVFFLPSKTNIPMNIIGLLSHRLWSNGIFYNLVEFLLSPVGELISVWIYSLFHYSVLSQ